MVIDDSGVSPPSSFTSKELGLAFGLVLAAGLSTTIGAASVFVFKHTNMKMLAASLGCSAGVMLWVVRDGLSLQGN
jgi:zinc transporter ZupT